MVTLEQIPFALLLRYFTIDRQHANWLARRRLIRFLYGREMLGEASKMLIRWLLALCYCFARTSHRCAGASFNWVISQFSTSLLTNDRWHCVLLGIRASPCAFVIGTTHHSLCECIVDATGPINFLIARSGQRDNTPRNWIETLVLKYPLAPLFLILSAPRIVMNVFVPLNFPAAPFKMTNDGPAKTDSVYSNLERNRALSNSSDESMLSNLTSCTHSTEVRFVDSKIFFSSSWPSNNKTLWNW